jgi:hypothetical protein
MHPKMRAKCWLRWRKENLRAELRPLIFGTACSLPLLLSVACATATTSGSSDDRCQMIKDSVSNSGFAADVTVTCDGTYAYLTSDTFPDHDLMNGILVTNEQIPVPALDYAAPIRLSPSGTSGTATIDAALGVAVNGVPIYDYSSQGDLDVNSYDAASDTVALGQLDNCGGHAGRGDDYHYHARPSCMVDDMDNKADSAIIGWAYDGYPLYDLKNPDGTTIAEGELDVCNGQVDDTFGYRYHTSNAHPYIMQCLRGDYVAEDLPRVSPMKDREIGTPPVGGVQNLVFTDTNGTRRLQYQYSGTTYYLEYTASATQANCYDFETKTVTSAGAVKTGTFCRE